MSLRESKVVDSYIELCNYQPLAILSPVAGIMATMLIDGLIDHNSWKDVYKVLVGLPILPVGWALISLELFTDYLFHPDVARRKYHNLVELAKHHNDVSPIKTYDIYWSRSLLLKKISIFNSGELAKNPSTISIFSSIFVSVISWKLY